jgi:hypothetical protein
MEKIAGDNDSLKVEERVEKDFRNFLHEYGEKLNDYTEETRLFLAFVSGAQSGSKYVYEVNDDAVESMKDDEQ